ncbi:hypothetical protein [Microbacterium halophytorum]|uniref:hypothetical protein n=1 Tax=Microbacterium halophytorum TaxID=2067568 RepID=UPI000CFE03CA|nr:hypothetical protein [Microbacterium halophytorum]
MSNPPVPPPAGQPGEGQQPAYGQPAYGENAPPAYPPQGQPPYAAQGGPGYPPGQGYPAAGYPAPYQKQPRPKGKPTLGIVAAIAAIVGVIAGCIIVGASASALGQYIGDATMNGMSDSYEYDEYATFDDTAFLPYLGGVFAGFAVYGILALWGLIQGIFATVLNRGRAWGITAIVVSVVGFVPVMITYGITFIGSIPMDSM